jgi:hypothetical protein
LLKSIIKMPMMMITKHHWVLVRQYVFLYYGEQLARKYLSFFSFFFSSNSIISVLKIDRVRGWIGNRDWHVIVVW